MTRARAPLTLLVFATAVALGPSPARAQAAPSDVSGLSAEALFTEGRRLMAEGRTAEACSKFRASDRLDPAVGTLLNLARCEKALGRTASAWLDYREAASRAHAAGETKREGVARAEADALAPVLPHLRVNVPEAARVQGLELTIDATVCPSSLWNSAVPLDPGSHRLEARAAGFEPWSTTLELVPAEELAATVPTLVKLRGAAPVEAVPARAAVPEPPSVAATDTSGVARTAPRGPAPRPSVDALKVGGYVLAGVGAALLVTGGGFALHAKRLDENSRENEHCDAASGCDPEGLRMNHDALHAAKLATGFSISGAVLLVSGVVLLLVPRRAVASQAVRPRPFDLRPALGSVPGLAASF